MVNPSGNSIHVPLHADGIGTVQFDVQRTGVVHHLLRSAGWKLGLELRVLPSG